MFTENDDSPSAPSWGTAAVTRGARYHDMAVAFLEAYPVGSVLSADAFGTWLIAGGYLEAPADMDKASDAWLAHLYRRNNLKKCLNKAASHPRLLGQGLQPYSVVGRDQTLEVLGATKAVEKANIGARIPKFVKTVRRQLAHLMQSTDWAQLPPYEKIFAETLFADTNKAELTIKVECSHLNDKYVALAKKLKKLNIALPSPDLVMREEQEDLYVTTQKFDDDAC